MLMYQVQKDCPSLGQFFLIFVVHFLLDFSLSGYKLRVHCSMGESLVCCFTSQSTAMVMSGHTFFWGGGGGKQYFMHMLPLVIDNTPS